jgi:hypothetical protein
VSEADRAQRLENINTLTKQLEASEADRARLLENTNTLTKQLEVSEADRVQRLENINTLTKQLASWRRTEGLENIKKRQRPSAHSRWKRFWNAK